MTPQAGAVAQSHVGIAPDGIVGVAGLCACPGVPPDDDAISQALTERDSIRHVPATASGRSCNKRSPRASPRIINKP